MAPNFRPCARLFCGIAGLRYYVASGHIGASGQSVASGAIVNRAISFTIACIGASDHIGTTDRTSAIDYLGTIGHLGAIDADVLL